MADKLKAGIAVKTVFVDGEIIRAAKLNALSTQLEGATRKLEAAIGDIHSESYPYSTLTSTELSLACGRDIVTGDALPGAPNRPLDIVTLGRLIGPASNLNPAHIGSRELTEDVPVGVYSWSLRFPPDNISAVTFTNTTIFNSQKATPQELIAAGDYYIDSYGRVFTISETLAGTVSYIYTPSLRDGGNTYQDSSFNVIPDINQLIAGDGCVVGAVNSDGWRLVVLPVVTHFQYDESLSSTELTEADLLYNQQLTLPKILTENWTVGEVIPGGFLYLKNYTKNKVYKSATYYYNSPTSFYIGGEDITDDVNAEDHFCVLTVGTDITTSINDLRKKLYHSHNRSFGEPLIDIKTLDNNYAEAGNSGLYVPSEIPGNHFAQYLHRDGYTDSPDKNINDENVLRGDLGIGAQANAGENTTAIAESYKVRFFGQGINSNKDSTIGRDIDGNLELEAGDGFDIEAKSVLTVEKGIRNNDLSYISLLSAWPIKPFVLTLTNQAWVLVGGLVLTVSVDLTTYGFDSNYTPLNYEVMVAQTGSEDWRKPSENTVMGYYPVLSYTGGTKAIGVIGTGTNWLTHNIDLRLIIWYYKA